jgi:rubrerythrin
MIMEKFESVDAALDFAIAREEEAFDLYHGLAAQTSDAELEKLFISFAKVEAGHKQKLERIKEDDALFPLRQNVVDLKVADYLVDVEPSPNMSYQDALILAVKREQAATQLYTHLAETVDNADLVELFNQLAKEEAAHKFRFEILYEENFLSEN